MIHNILMLIRTVVPLWVYIVLFFSPVIDTRDIDVDSYWCPFIVPLFSPVMIYDVLLWLVFINSFYVLLYCWRCCYWAFRRNGRVLSLSKKKKKNAFEYPATRRIKRSQASSFRRLWWLQGFYSFFWSLSKGLSTSWHLRPRRLLGAQNIVMEDVFLQNCCRKANFFFSLIFRFFFLNISHGWSVFFFISLSLSSFLRFALWLQMDWKFTEYSDSLIKYFCLRVI